MGSVGSKKREYKVDHSSDGKSEVDNDFVEQVICKDEDFKDGTMEEFEIGKEGHKILLLKENGCYSALGTKCTHYGAPLKNGVFSNGQIRCPWHGACFNSETGDIEDFPGLDSLPHHEVCVENGNVKVKASVFALKNNKRVKPMIKYCPTNAQTFVVIGGGAAGQACVETLRQEGFSGKLILISKEKNLPYDRPKLSKALDTKASDLFLRNEQFYKAVDISLMLDTEVTGLDTAGNWVSCKNGKLKVKYDRLLIATGGQPVKLDAPGSDLKNIFYLRTPEDGNAIAKESQGKSVVVVGSSFIGMEVAAFLLRKAESVNVIGRSSVPFSAAFGEQVGTRIKSLFEEKGLVFHSDKSVTKFLGSNGKLESVELSSGETLKADVCIVGIGVRASTDFLEDSDIKRNSRGQIIVDEHLGTSVSGIFAAGDIVQFPLSTYGNAEVNVQHWQMALSHGRTAAFNMMGKCVAFRSVPFFWCALLGKNFRYAGYAPNYDEVIIKGDLENLQFVAHYVKDQQVVAVCSMNRDPEAAKFASGISCGNVVLKNNII